jgi:hypothetical protein
MGSLTPGFVVCFADIKFLLVAWMAWGAVAASSRRSREARNNMWHGRKAALAVLGPCKEAKASVKL